MGNLLTRCARGLLAVVFLIASGSALAEAIAATPVGAGYTSRLSGTFDAFRNNVICKPPAGAVFQSQLTCPGGTVAGEGDSFTCALCRDAATGQATVYDVIDYKGAYFTCPDSTWTLSGSTCTRPDVTCNGNQSLSDDGLSCRCNLNSLNALIGTGERPWFEGSGSMPSSLCDGGCMRSTGFGLGGGGKWSVQGGAFTGEKCDGTGATSDPTPPEPNNPAPCSPSQGVMTSTSGTVACVPEGTPDARPPTVTKTTKTETMPDGSTRTTTTTTTTDPATGATSTSTTTTTTAGPSGGTTAGEPGTSTGTSDTAGTDTDGDGIGDGTCEGEDCGEGSDFCEKHPESMVCKESKFSGSCSDGETAAVAPTCEGDASLCAIAKAAFETKCAVTNTKGTDYGQKLIDGQDPMKGELPDPSKPTEHNLGALAYSDVGGSCPPDINFTIMGRASTISMANACTVGGWLGNIGVALSLLVAGFIVVGAIRNS